MTGDSFVTASHTIGEEDIMSFAKLTGDMHPQHTDADPVKIGDTIHVEGQVVGSREVDDETELEEHRWRVLNQDGRMVLRMNVEVVCRRARALAT